MSTDVTRLEDRSHLSAEQTREVRRRSRALLATLLRPLRGRITLAVTIIVVSQAFAVVGPMAIAYAVDTALPQVLDGNATPATFAVAAYVLAAIGEGVLVAVFVRMMASIAQAVLLDLRQRMFRHTQRLGLEFHETYTSGKIISRQTNDLEALQNLVNSGLSDLVAGVIYMVFVTFAIFVLDPVSGCVIVGFLIPVGLLFGWFRRRSSVLYRESSTRSAKVLVQFVETMTGIRAVKAFRREGRNQAKYERLAADYRDTNLRMLFVFGTLFTTTTLLGNLAVGSLVLVNGFRVVSGGLGIGVLMASLLYARQFFDPINTLGEVYNSFQSAAASLEKISGVLSEEPTVDEPASPVPLARASGDLRFERVEFGYDAAHVVLPQFSLHIPAGQTVALVGTTGAGKTTVAKLLARFYDPTSGSVQLDGIDLRLLAGSDLRRDLVMVTQEAYLFSGSVADNIALGRPSASRAEIERAAAAIGADRFIRALPDGYDTDVSKRGGRLSAGQRQLVSFARAFLADPAVLILDEATSSLDIPSERAVQDALETLLDDRTAIIIAHRLSTVAIADRVLVMEAGRIIEDGTPAALIDGDGRFSALHRAWRESLV